MRTEYKRDMNHNYLVLHEEMELDTSSYQVRMLAGNVIPSLLKCQFHGVNGKIVFHYEITSKQSIAVLYEDKMMGEEDLRLIFGSFVQVMEQMAEYLLNPGQVLLQPEYMYMDVNKKEIYFCYLPGKEREVKEQFQALTEYVLPKLDHGDERAVMLGYGVYRRAMEDSFHLEHVKEELFRGVVETKETIVKNKEHITADTSEKESIILEKENYEQESLEALFGYADEGISEKNVSKKGVLGKDTKSVGKPEGTKKNDHNLKKQGQIQQKVYIIVPVVGTVVIMAILAANMLGILPWLRVEVLLLAVVFICMAASLISFIIGKVQGKKRKEENDRQWKDKVKKFKETAYEEPENGVKDIRFNIVKEESTGFEKKKSEWLQGDEKEETFHSFRKNRQNQQEDYGETVVLSASTVRGPASMVSREPGELATIYLKDDLTVIGKLETAADAVIPLPTISRLHAKIRKREGEYYLADLNSRNGTSVNGRMLQVNEEYLLQDEDEVDFAEARYIFLK